MERTYEQAVADLVEEARKSADWLTKFCCSHNGHAHGLELSRRLGAVEEASGPVVQD